MELIIGSIVSLFVQWIKGTNASKLATYGILIGVSILAALIYTQLVSAGLWESIALILAIAGGFHNFVIRRFEE